MLTQNACRSLAQNLVDYAGMFPPKKQSLSEALAQYRNHESGQDAWILGRFLCPTTELGGLVSGGEVCDRQGIFPLGAVARQVQEGSSFFESFIEDLEECREFCSACKGAGLDTLEVRLPLSSDNWPSFFGHAQRAVASHLGEKVRVFFEVHWKSKLWEEDLECQAQACREIFGELGGLKLRCGGIQTEDIPPVSVLTDFIQTCHKFRVKMKVTAGLHHPLFHIDDDLGVEMHGFLNVFGAAMMAWHFDWDRPLIEEFLQEKDPEQFHFTTGSFRWKEWSLSPESIGFLRKSCIGSFGSCSFTQPRDDLKQLGWIA